MRRSLVNLAIKQEENSGPGGNVVNVRVTRFEGRDESQAPRPASVLDEDAGD